MMVQKNLIKNIFYTQTIYSQRYATPIISLHHAEIQTSYTAHFSSDEVFNKR